MSHAFCDCCRRPTDDCLVMAEIRSIKDGTAGRNYLQLLAARNLELGSGRPFVDVPRLLQKANAPMDSIAALQAKQDTPAMKGAERFIAARASALFLLLSGPTGAGKTTAAVRVMQDAVRRVAWNSQATGEEAMPLDFVPASRLTGLSAFDRESSGFVQRLRNLTLLVLDDAGDEATPTGLAAFTDLCVTRCALRKRTVITSNLTADAFKARYGDALADRIRATGIVPNLANEKSLRKRVSA